MKTELKAGHRVVENLYFVDQPSNEPLNDTDPIMWLNNQAKNHPNTNMTILAHALDGVIWGRLENGEVITGDRILPDLVAPFRSETLEQVRIFDETTEWYLWKSDKTWLLRQTHVHAGSSQDGSILAFGEYHVLWGTHAPWRDYGFTLVEDGMQGLRHLLPISLSAKFPSSSRRERDTPPPKAKRETNRVCLRLRHFTTTAENGILSIARSCLVGLEEVEYGS